MSIAILGISFSQLGNVIDNPETVLPKVLMELFPVGIKGLLVAGLLAAAMSTYVAIVNSGATYWVNDFVSTIHIRPEATNKELNFTFHSFSCYCNSRTYVHLFIY